MRRLLSGDNLLRIISLALANVLVALEHGVATFDAAAGGIGGSGRALSAAGNLSTEDLIGLLDALGIEHGLDLDGVVTASGRVFDFLDVTSPSRVHQAVRNASSRADLPLPCA